MIGHGLFIKLFIAPTWDPHLCDTYLIDEFWNWICQRISPLIDRALAPMEDVDFTCYTDGSHVEGHTGTGFTLFYAGEEVFNNSIYLGTLASVFQAELYAIT
jgi:hypothetical protein